MIHSPMGDIPESTVPDPFITGLFNLAYVVVGFIAGIGIAAISWGKIA